MKIVIFCLTTLVLCVSFVSANQVYGTVQWICGEDFDIKPNEEIEITTPNFPLPYPNNSNCTWRFCAENPNHIIILQFGVFQLENDHNCDSWDFVNLYDGEYIDPMKKLGAYCGDLTCDGFQIGFYPFAYEMTSNERCMTVSFCSDGFVQRLGFEAEIRSDFPEQVQLGRKRRHAKTEGIHELRERHNRIDD